MAIIFIGQPKPERRQKWYTFEWGKGQGQRRATGIFTYAKPKDLIQKQHNQEAKKLLDIKHSELTLDLQSEAALFLRIESKKIF